MWENACNFVVASDNVVVLLMPTFGIGVNCVVSIGSCVHSAKNTNIVLLLQLYGNVTSLGSCEACIKSRCQRHQFPIVPLFGSCWSCWSRCCGEAHVPNDCFELDTKWGMVPGAGHHRSFDRYQSQVSTGLGSKALGHVSWKLIIWRQAARIEISKIC